MHTTLMSTAELAQHLGDPKFVILDCRFKLEDVEAGRRAYGEAHIPGALYAHLDDDLSGPKTGHTGRHPLPSEQAMIATFSTWGIDSQTQVVTYDQAGGFGGSGAARAWWMLHYMGHAAAAVLDGGWPVWQAETRPTESTQNKGRPSQFVGAARPALRQEVDTLLSSELTLIDCRAPARYRGAEEAIDRVAGHIPGAKNLPWNDLSGSDGRALLPDQLRARLQAVLGNTPPEQTVFYCGSGVSAAADVLAMEAAGLQGSKLYVGSWSEWISDPQRPIVTGNEL